MSNRKIIRLLLLCNLLLLVIHVFLSFKGMGNVLLSRTTLMTPLVRAEATPKETANSTRHHRQAHQQS